MTAGVNRLWLVTTNGNPSALRIPLHDELVLEHRLEPTPRPR